MNDYEYEQIIITDINNETILEKEYGSGKQLRYIKNPVRLQLEINISESEYEKLLQGAKNKNKKLITHIHEILKSSASRVKLEEEKK